ncbi:MAG: hypothetical protein ACYTG5_06905 [Planctomycetota bacterium]|jgi:hypothetical protein
MRKRLSLLCLGLTLLCGSCIGTDYDSYVWSEQAAPKPVHVQPVSEQAVESVQGKTEKK